MEIPKFSLEGELEEQRGCFFRTEVLPDYLQLLSSAVGTVGSVDVIGTGFLASCTRGFLFLSARHCFYDDRITGYVEREVLFPSGRKIIVRPEQFVDLPEDWEKSDLLVAELGNVGLGIEPLQIASHTEAVAGSYKPKVVILGNPYLGKSRLLDPLASVGQVTDWFYLKSGTPYLMETNARVEPGSSGSPLLNEAGKVFGVVRSISGCPPNYFGLSATDRGKFWRGSRNPVRSCASFLSTSLIS